MKRFILLFTALLVGFCASAQITKFEYFIDNDPGVGKGTLVNKSFTGAGQIEIPTTGLTSGFHNLVIRAKQSNGRWSISENRPFYVQPQAETVGSSSLVAYEYFFDTDPGVGNGTHVSIAKNAKVTLEEVVKTANIPYGFHILGLRFFDDKGKASITESRPFYIMQQIEKEATPKIVLLEYSFDTLGGFGSGAIINTDPVSAINKEYSLPYSNLAKGNHILYMRAKDSKGVWSMAESTTFKVDDNVNGINDELISSFTCYPNPSKGIFIINGINQNENCKLEVFTINGKLIYRRENVNSQAEVDISNETNGVYLLKITSNEKMVIKKIVLNK